MNMFIDREDRFLSGSQSSSSSSTNHSTNSSFCSDSAWDSCSFVETPTSELGSPFNSIKAVDKPFLTATPSCTPREYVGGHDFMQLSSMTQGMLSGFQEHMLFSGDNQKMLVNHDMMGYNNFSTYSGRCDSFGSHDGLPTPSLDLDTYSPNSSQVSGDFVVPSQTTFLHTFDMNSPMRPVKPLHFELQYDNDSPASHYATDYSLTSPCRSFKYSMPSSTTESTSNTPSRPNVQRQLLFEPLSSSVALHHIQEKVHVGKQTQAVRQQKRRAKREVRNYMVPNSIRVQKVAKKKCTWAGCHGRFQRQEHLKRHEKTHLNVEQFPCQFCGKEFGRSDNLKSHIKLHADAAKKSSRTKHFPEAAKAYEQMTRKPRKTEPVIKEEMKISRSSRVLGY